MSCFKAELGIICAMQVELDNIKGSMETDEVLRISGVDFICGTLNGVKTVAAVCGIGKVFAAMCAQTMILKFNPSAIINTGVAGGLSKTLSIKDAVVAESLVQHDMDTSALGDPVGLISGINMVNLPTDEKISGLLLSCAKETGIHTESGVIVSGDTFISDNDKKTYLVKTFNALACEMEGASIAQVCYVNKVPFSVLRTISDGGDESAKMDYPEFVAQAAVVSGNIVRLFAEKMKGKEF